MVTLKKISILDDDMKDCIALEFLPEQTGFVAENAISLAEAYDTNKAYAENGEGDQAVPYAVYENGNMVGFVMYGYFPAGSSEGGDEPYYNDEPHYYIWRLFIDKNHQGRGLGRKTVDLIMEEIKRKPCGEASYCYTSYAPKNAASRATFASYGYEEDGRVISGEVVARYKLP